MVYKGLNRLARIFFPPSCVLCGERGADRDLCKPCETQLPWIDTRCFRCALPLAGDSSLDERQLCGRCLQEPPYFDCVLSPLRYEQPVDWMVQRLKFNANLSHIRVLADLLKNHLSKSRLLAPDLIVPVPLHVNRLSERGFNQATELARMLAGSLSIPMSTDLCQRQKDTPQQSALSASRRRKNLRNAFSVTADPQANRIAIVDDVVTTGATVNALARVLKERGVKHIQVWSVARTPSDRH